MALVKAMRRKGVFQVLGKGENPVDGVPILAFGIEWRGFDEIAHNKRNAAAAKGEAIETTFKYRGREYPKEWRFEERSDGNHPCFYAGNSRVVVAETNGFLVWILAEAIGKKGEKNNRLDSAKCDDRDFSTCLEIIFNALIENGWAAAEPPHARISANDDGVR